MVMGLQTIIDAGGERAEFMQAKIGVDRPDLDAQEIFTSTSGELEIVSDFLRQFASAGIHCPPMVKTH